MWNLEVTRTREEEPEYLEAHSLQFDGEDLDIHEIIDRIAEFLIGVGYHHETVAEGFKSYPRPLSMNFRARD